MTCCQKREDTILSLTLPLCSPQSLLSALPFSFFSSFSYATCPSPSLIAPNSVLRDAPTQHTHFWNSCPPAPRPAQGTPRGTRSVTDTYATPWRSEGGPLVSALYYQRVCAWLERGAVCSDPLESKIEIKCLQIYIDLL